MISCPSRSPLPSGDFKCTQRKRVFGPDEIVAECELCVCDCRGEP
jgi:hypothetical protein